MATGIRTLRQQVAQAMDDGASLDDVEQAVIRQAPLSPELRSALWLYAWALDERESQPPPAVERLRA
jgi:hypothetical protein